VDLHRNQIIVWIRIDDVLRPLPAILDTVHGHSASIGKGQLQRWSGASLKRIGELEVGLQWVLPVFARTIHGRGDCKASPAKKHPRGDCFLPRPTSLGAQRHLVNSSDVRASMLLPLARP
jgi:hypothetical protein